MPLFPCLSSLLGLKCRVRSGSQHLLYHTYRLTLQAQSNMHNGESPNQVTYKVLSTWRARFTLKLRSQQIPFQYMERKLEENLKPRDGSRHALL